MAQTLDQITALLEDARVQAVPEGPYVRAPAENYRVMCHDVLRQTHAHEAADQPDAAGRYEYGGTAMHLWTRQGPDDADWTALVTSVNRTEHGPILNAGYRVAADGPDEAAALAADPSRALATLLTRYGVSYYTDTRVYFTPQHLVNLPVALETLGPDSFAKAVGLEEPPPGAQVAVNVAAALGRDGTTRLSWFYVLDLTKYERETRARRR